MPDFRRLHPRLTETDLDSTPFVPELSPVVDRQTTGELMTRPWLDWARRLTLLVGVKSGGGGGTGTGDVVGPNGATPDAIAIYSGSTGKLIKDSLTSIGSVISQAVSQAIAAILPGGKLPVSNLPLHKTTHQAGGVDAVDVKLLAGYPGNNTTFLDGTGTFTTPAGAGGGMNLDYFGNYVPATYNDGDIVVAVDGIAYMCVKDGTSTPPEAWPGGAPLLAAHHVTHEPGGSDPMAVDAAVAVGSLRTLGTGPLQAAPGNDARFTAPSVPTAHATTHQPGGSDAMAVDAAAAVGSLRTLGTGANQAAPGNDTRFTVPANHAPRHSLGGADPVTVTNLAGYPGGTSNFLRADGTFATPTAGVPGAHHTTHEPGGSDALVNAAWVNVANNFTQPQTLAAVQPAFYLQESGQAANLKQWRMTAAGQVLYFQPADDAGQGVSNALRLDRSNNAVVGNNLTVTGSGGNVACKDQANTFSIAQTISAGTPALYINETSAPANARKWVEFAGSQLFYIQAVNDAGGTLTVPLTCDRGGSVRIGKDIFEKGRTAPLLNWIQQDLAAYTQTAGVSGPILSALAGNHLFITGIATITIASPVPYVRINLPYGAAPQIAYSAPIVCYLAAVAGWDAGWVNFTGATSMDLTPRLNQQWSAGTNYCGFSLTIPIQVGI